ncbi:MAG: hypothetical protein ABSE85_08290, partial [Candidatus Korobacteraceae bacterium]
MPATGADSYALCLQREQIATDPLVLFVAQIAARHIEGDAGQMGGSGIAELRRREAVPAAQAMLLLNSANHRGDQQVGMELVVISLAEVLEEFARPGTAIMPVFGQIGGEFQSVGFGDGHQFLGKLVTC